MVLEVLQGTTIFIDVTISNSGGNAGNAYIRCGLVTPNNTLLELQTTGGSLDGVLSLNPGEIKVITFVALLDSSLPLGNYGTEIAVYDQPSRGGNQLAFLGEMDQVSLVSPAPPPPTPFAVSIVGVIERL